MLGGFPDESARAPAHTDGGSYQPNSNPAFRSAHCLRHAHYNLRSYTPTRLPHSQNIRGEVKMRT